MSRIRADKITNKGANGAPDFPDGLTVTGVITATTLNQTLNGDLTVTGKVSIGGTLTYEDVTNIDSVGIITARDGVRVGTGGTIGPVGAGIVTYYGDGSQLTGIDTGISTDFVSSQGLTVVGVTTFQGDTYMAGNPKKMYLNKSGADEISIWSSGWYGYITHAWGSSYQFQINSNGTVKFGSATSPWKTNALIKNNAEVQLNYANEERFKTSGYGIEIHENTGNPSDGARIDIRNSSGNQWASIRNNGATGVSDLRFHTVPSGGDPNDHEKLRINSNGAFGLGGANFGTNGQVLTSKAAGVGVTWADVSAPSYNSSGLSIDTSGTSSTIALTLKAPQNDRLTQWRNDQGGDGSWYATGASNSIDLRWNSYSAEVLKLFNAGDVKVTTGNLVIGTAGKGIDFSATTDASGHTSSLFDDYEEGTWTPADGGGIVPFANQVGTYVKVGRNVTCYLYIRTTVNVTDTGNVYLVGLPFTSANQDPRGVSSVMVNISSNQDSHFQGWLVSANSTIAYGYKTNFGNTRRVDLWDGSPTNVSMWGYIQYQTAA